MAAWLDHLNPQAPWPMDSMLFIADRLLAAGVLPPDAARVLPEHDIRDAEGRRCNLIHPHDGTHSNRYGEWAVPPPAAPGLREARSFDRDGTYRPHHAADPAEPIWWQNAEQFGGEKR